MTPWKSDKEQTVRKLRIEVNKGNYGIHQAICQENPLKPLLTASPLKYKGRK